MAKWFNNAAASTIGPPQKKTDVYQTVHARHYGVEILTGVLAFVVLFAFAWWFITGLMDDAGYKVQDLVNVLIGGGRFVFYLSILALVIVAASKIYNSIMNEHHRRWMEREELLQERLKTTHAIQQSSTTETRATDPKIIRRNKLIIALMTDALIHDEYNFSYRKAGNYILSNESKPLGKDSTIVKMALGWLKGQGAIDDGLLTTKFSSIGDVQRTLYSPPLLDNKTGIII